MNFDCDVEKRIAARRTDISLGADKIKLYYVEKTDQTFRAAAQIPTEEVSQGASVPSFLELDQNMAQKLMDDLWDCGLRPTEGTGSAGAMAAVENHLNDLRKITFATIGIED